MKPFENLRHDIPASVVVLFVAVPLCLGIALASGAPLLSGLIAGVIGGVVVGSLSGSALGVSGPAAGLVVLVIGAIEELGSFEAFLVTVVLAGVFQIALGLLRAGVIGYFFPNSVIKGMLTAIGIIIILKQVPHAVGYDGDYEGDVDFVQSDGGTTLSTLWRMWDYVDLRVAMVAAIALAMLILWEKVLTKKHKFFTLIQGPIAAVGFGILYQVICSRFAPALAISPKHLVSVPQTNGVDDFMALFTGPDWSVITSSRVWILGATIAIVASLETLLCTEATDRLDPYKRNTPNNRELIAQGTGNLLSGLVGGLPVTQVIVRSSANIQSGARTKMSAILHGVLLFVSVVLLPGLLNLVPLGVLASILIVVGYKLAKPSIFRVVFAQGRAQYIPFLATVVGVVFTDLLFGIAFGLLNAVMFLLYCNYQNSHFLHIQELDRPGEGHRVTLRLAEEVSFLNKGAIRRELSEIPDGSHVIIDTSACVSIDLDVREIIEDFKSTASTRDITVEMIEKRPAFASLPKSA